MYLTNVSYALSAKTELYADGILASEQQFSDKRKKIWKTAIVPSASRKD